MTFKCYTRLEKGLKLKVRKFLGIIRTFVEVTGEKLVGMLPFSILERVKSIDTSLFLIVKETTERQTSISKFPYYEAQTQFT